MGLDTVEEKLTEFENIAIKTTQNETYPENKKFKKGKNRVLVTSEKTTED